MQNLIGVFGSGGFGKQVMPLVKAQYSELKSDDLVFIDDITELKTLMGHKILRYKDFLAHPSSVKKVTIAIADNRAREKLLNQLIADNIEIITVKAHTAQISEYSTIATGGTLANFTCIFENTRIGESFHINIYSYVGHDCIIGNYVTFGPRVSCNGHVHIHDNVYIGTGAIIKEGTADKPLVIGEGAFIGMGALVTKDVPPGAVAVGKPARAIQSKQPG